MQIIVLPGVILCNFFRRLTSLGFLAGVAGLAPGWSLIVQGQQGLPMMGTCSHHLSRSLLIRHEILEKDWHLISKRWQDTDGFLWDRCRRLEYGEANLCPQSVLISKPVSEWVFQIAIRTRFRNAPLPGCCLSPDQVVVNALAWWASPGLGHRFPIPQKVYVKILDFHYVNKAPWRTINQHALKWLKYTLSVSLSE